MLTDIQLGEWGSYLLDRIFDLAVMLDNGDSSAVHALRSLSPSPVASSSRNRG